MKKKGKKIRENIRKKEQIFERKRRKKVRVEGGSRVTLFSLM